MGDDLINLHDYYTIVLTLCDKVCIIIYRKLNGHGILNDMSVPCPKRQE